MTSLPNFPVLKQLQGLTKEEKLLWEAVLKTVTPLKEKKTSSRCKKPTSETEIKLSASLSAPMFKILKNPSPVPSLKNQDPLFSEDFPSIEKHTTRKLKTNKILFSATLDLHGLTQDLAYEKLKAFIFENYAKGRRYLLIITGKGKGILRKAFLNWLHEEKFRSLISAVEESYPHHGGAGAFYVVLKKTKQY